MLGQTLTGVAAEPRSSATAKPGAEYKQDAPLARINVTRRVSALNNDIEVAFTNTGSDDVTITAITPQRTITGRGVVDYSSLLTNGPLFLSSGESVVVPMVPHSKHIESGCLLDGGCALGEDLRRRLSIITDGNAFAAVHVEGLSRLS